jgi:DNA primase
MKHSLNIAMKKSIDVYHDFLIHPVIGSLARDYLKSRGISEAHIEKFKLGFAPDEWQNLKELSGNASSDKLLVDAGLLIENEKGHTYSRFRNRVMFPIYDRVGRPIAFGGRTMGDEKPKYLNSPETAVFKKSHELYNIDIARKSSSEYLIVTEGYMDVVTASIFDLDNCCASLGTAINEDQIERLFHIKPYIIFCFDGDKAGQKAANAALEKVLASPFDINSRFVIFPDNHDLDSFLNEFGAEEFCRICESAPDQFDYLDMVLSEKFEPTIIGDAKARHYQSSLGLKP